MKATTERTLALAGTMQAAALVTQLAETNEYDQQALKYLALSVLDLKAESAEEIYDGADGVALGLRTLENMLSAPPDSQRQAQIRYALLMQKLSGSLHRATRTADGIGQGIERIAADYDLEVDDDTGDDNSADIEWNALYIDLAGLYQQTISTLEPKIIVRGAEGRLTDSANVARVRTAIFAGVRAAYLWTQLGGQRWHLVVSRKGYLQKATQLLRLV